MACPNGGCLNGGGQVLFHSQNSVVHKNKLLKEIRKNYLNLPVIDQNKSLNNLTQLIKGENIPLKTTFKSVQSFDKLNNETNKTINSNSNSNSNLNSNLSW